MIFIRKKKLIKFIKEKQIEIRKSNREVSNDFRKEGKTKDAIQWQYYEDGNDNAFNHIISIIERW